MGNNKDELLDMIQHGAEKIINTSQSMMIDQDIDDIIKRGEEKTAELNSKYQGLDLDALNNFKSESMVNTWEGEDFAGKVSLIYFLYHLRHLDRVRDEGNTMFMTGTRGRRGRAKLSRLYSNTNEG